MLQVSSRVRALGLAVIAGVALTTTVPPAPVAAATAADKVISIAMAQRGDPWRYAATGPSSFDCSGLVIYAFKQAGYGSVIGNGNYRSAYALLDWFRDRGKATRSGGQRGDLVIYGGGSHVGIYLGDGKVVSTLTSGVAVHGLHAVTASFTAFLRTGLSGSRAASTGSAIVDVPDQVRYTTASVRMRTGPGTQYSSVGTLPAGSKVLMTKLVHTSVPNHNWLWVWSYEAGRSVWVAGWYTKAG